ncbi:MAG TPA: CPBP family intramembrane glutamic endopeptidase [Candidatus Acidoferrales bacterium]|nr:CPBP family intramembrane glutamic endopeptidase [Candidatus Acidoferrales bacterium]
MQNVTASAVAALAAELSVAAVFGFAADRAAQAVQRWPAVARILIPSLLVLPYVLIAASYHVLLWRWFALYAALPAAIAWLLGQASKADPQRRGNWRDVLILLLLGLAVDLRWFESAWPVGLRPLNELLLVDAGLYGFLAVRHLDGTGFDFRIQWGDARTGLRELAFFTPIVVLLGLALSFIHPHANWPAAWKAALAWIGIFFFTAVPEELFFRAWVQNFLERRVGRRWALVIASVVFGLSHFNKRNPLGVHFNWRYVILATIAGVFYGRAWRERRRVPASAITHTCVDWLWSWWF